MSNYRTIEYSLIKSITLKAMQTDIQMYIPLCILPMKTITNRYSREQGLVKAPRPNAGCKMQKNCTKIHLLNKKIIFLQVQSSSSKPLNCFIGQIICFLLTLKQKEYYFRFLDAIASLVVGLESFFSALFRKITTFLFSTLFRKMSKHLFSALFSNPLT